MNVRGGEKIMVELSKVLDQLSKAGYRARMWQRAEVKELCNILHDEETILHATNGYYEGGFSLLVATDHRLLLVDRKPMFLTLDSIAYSMIQELSFNYRLLNSTIHIYTSNKVLDFNSWNQSQIRAILTVAQNAMRLEKQSTNPQPQPISAMQYEPQALSDTYEEQVPTMPAPAPHFTNENTRSAYDSMSKVNNMGIKPASMSTEQNVNPYKTPSLAQRQYTRRYY
jgi:hypothetical protein